MSPESSRFSTVTVIMTRSLHLPPRSQGCFREAEKGERCPKDEMHPWVETPEHVRITWELIKHGLQIVSYSVSLGGGLRACVSDEDPSDAAAGGGPPLKTAETVWSGHRIIAPPRVPAQYHMNRIMVERGGILGDALCGGARG